MDPEGFEALVVAAAKDLDPDRLELFIAVASREELEDRLRTVCRAARCGMAGFSAALPLTPPISPFASAAS